MPLPNDPTRAVDAIFGRYRGGRDRLFILHGNVGDLFPFAGPSGVPDLLTLPDYLFGAFTSLSPRSDTDASQEKIWMHYALPQPIRWVNTAADGATRAARLLEGSVRREQWMGAVKAPLPPLDFFRLVVDGLSRRKEDSGGLVPLRIVATEAHLIVPDSQTVFMSPQDRELLVLLKRFAAEPAYDASDTLIVLITETLSAVHRELREVAATIEIPRPDEAEIGDYLDASLTRYHVEATTGDRPRLRRLVTGLTRRQVETTVAECAALKEPLAIARLRERRQELVARDYGDLIEFFEPEWTLADVGGSAEAVAELMEIAEAFRRGDRDIPSGIVLAGQNGIGKTFLGKAFFGTAGITGASLKSLRDSLLGATERNWEKIAVGLRSQGQIGVIVDEADAQMGNRSGPNVHETSRTLFAAQMQLMGDPKYRGRIFWILMTCRPDKLAPDVKRPGRCERVIPLFPAAREEDAAAILKAQMALLARREGYRFDPAFAVGSVSAPLIGKTGAQIEQVIRRAKKKFAKDDPVSVAHLMSVLAAGKQFDAEPEAYELQRLLAIAEAVETENDDLIPEYYRKEVVDKYRGIEGVKTRIDLLRRRLDG